MFFLDFYEVNMNVKIENHKIHGECVFIDNGTLSIGIPLNFGIRVCHFSFLGEENLFFEHPNDMTAYCKPEGWRHRGGHRIWTAPEGHHIYAPDNLPIKYEIFDGGIEVTQPEDPWIHVIKTLRITFIDDTSVEVTNFMKNVGCETMRCSVWAVTAMKIGGVQSIDFELRSGGCDPWHKISMWDYTNLGDSRASYSREGIVLRGLPIDARYKIGVGHPYGPIRYELSDTVFIKSYDIFKDKEYPDGNVSYETYLSEHMVEMETLSPITDIKVGETAQHSEIWRLERKA